MPVCDKCMRNLKKVRRIELGGGSGAYLCDACLKQEIAWRRGRNKTLSKRAKFRVKYKFWEENE
jgi:hypothetical protein